MNRYPQLVWQNGKLAWAVHVLPTSPPGSVSRCDYPVWGTISEFLLWWTLPASSLWVMWNETHLIRKSGILSLPKCSYFLLKRSENLNYFFKEKMYPSFSIKAVSQRFLWKIHKLSLIFFPWKYAIFQTENAVSPVCQFSPNLYFINNILHLHLFKCARSRYVKIWKQLLKY